VPGQRDDHASDDLPRGEDPQDLEARYAALDLENRDLDRRLRNLQQLVDDRDRQLEQALIDLREVKDQSERDPLTRLANRQTLRRLMAQLARRGDRCAVLAIDVDRFGRLNETLGHDVGDRLLVELADRLRHAVRSRDTVARWGGDEFMVVMPGVRDLTTATAMAETVRSELGRPVQFDDGASVVCSISVGVAVTGSGLVEPDVLLRQVDTALERAKARGKDRVEVFGDELGVDARRRFETEHLLRQALDEGWFELYFQPVHPNDEGYPVAAEALLRLRHPDGTLLLPGAFLDVAEETGLARPIGNWVVEEACRIASRWVGRLPPFRLAVNVSAAQLGPDFPSVISGSLQAHGLDPSVLVVELTEHTLLEADDDQVEALVAVRRAGVRIALDDFGTAYSSLNHLRRFPVDVVKIDKSFVAGFGRSDQDHAIVKAVVDLSHTFRFRVIAEGVETAEQFDQQLRLGCHGAQGYLIGHPKPAEAFERLLASRPVVDVILGRTA
jgi:diguanylate cyclase (GGDEF)-like protein